MRGHCPATGIVDYLIVKDHPRPSPRLLARVIRELQRLVKSFSGQIRPVHGAASVSPCRVIARGNEKSRRGRLHLGGFRRNL
jgi:hypothetical protein